MKRKEYYKSEQWKMLRNTCLAMAGYICQECGSAGRQVGGQKILQAHHKTYARLYNEDLEDLMCVCVECHKRIHKKMR